MADDNKTEVDNSKNRFTSGQGWLYGLLALVVLVLVFIAGLAVANNRVGPYHRAYFDDGGVGMMQHRGMNGFGMLGSNFTKNGQTRASGVVTSVNGSNFTIASSGATQKITTSDSTQYQGGNTVKQNDTVIVWGTESNDTIKADTVVINP